MVPNIRDAYKDVVAFIRRNASYLRESQMEAASELKRRIKRMEGDFNRLIKINNLLLEAEMPHLEFEESTDTITITNKGHSRSIKLNRADPNVPIQLLGSTSIGAYKAGSQKPSMSDVESENLKMLMEQMLEHYYANAFRITKLVQVVTGSKKYHCSEITIVRNKLIEHPDTGSIYSFGFGTNGPVVKPIQRRGQRKWNDKGLVPNTTALVESLRVVFSRDA